MNKTYLTLLELRQELFDYTKATDSPDIHFDDLVLIFQKFIDREKPKDIDAYKKELGLSYANEDIEYNGSF